MFAQKAFFILVVAIAIQTAKAQDAKVSSLTMKNIRLDVSLTAKGTPQYAVYFKEKTVISASEMGFSLTEGKDLHTGFEVMGKETKQADETWQPVWGEVKNIRNHYQQLTVHLKQKTSNLLLDIVFKVFEDGVGFRYEFPKQAGLKYFIVADELTQFNLTGDHKTFWIPGDYDSNEYPYSTTRISEIDNRDMVAKSTSIAVRIAPDPKTVQTPLMMKSQDGLYINIHEAALVNYPAMQLRVNNSNYHLTSSLVPDAYGNKAYLHAPSHTPWRTILVSDQAIDILSSKTILNLNDPAKTKNTSWIKPMKFIGVWWEMQTGLGTWNYSDFADSVSKDGKLIPNGKHSANTTNVKKYIDFAAANNIKGVLVEGWNTGWEDWFGNWKENVFDFVTPYPDYDVKEIIRYAKLKGVSMIMHNETSGSATNYERQLDTAYRFMNQFGFSSVKTGYVGRIIPRGEHHDGQWMVAHYERVAQKALDHRVTVDMHESVRPTGLHRTYPNWVANEAARGNEFNAFSDDGNPPEHETILPFTRLMGGPMDYTPGIFKLKGYASYAPDRQLHTTLAKQLALYVTLYSPVQMAADLPKNYMAHMDAFQFIKDVAVDWDDTQILEAEPGDYVTIARKEKGKDNWFLGSITDEHGRSTDINLNFLDKGKKYIATIYADATDADVQKKPEAYQISKQTVDASSKLHFVLANGGGVAVSFVVAK
ncbi:MAG: glycoside hydrolase family 97 protein [Bacteroidota bacterium]